MTYNILNGGEGREAYLRQILETVQPDVAILQEVFQESLVQNFARSLNMNSFFASGNARRRVALLSRLPLVSCQSHHPFPPIWRNVVEAEIEYQPGKSLWIFGVHPIANLSVIYELWRWWEAKQIVQYLRSHAAQPCLIAGDFNAIAPADQVALQSMPHWLQYTLLLQGNRAYHFSIREYLSAGLTDCFRTMHPVDTGFTLPPPHPNSRLDYIFVTEPLKPHLIDCQVVREPVAVLKASDHYPVVAEFRL